MKIKELDVFIVGAGIIGLSLALGLAKQGFQVGLVDKAKAPSPPNQDLFSPRVSAISLASQTLLTELGAWPLIARKQPYTNMDVWDKDGFGEIAFSSEDSKQHVIPDTIQGEVSQQSVLGHIIENDVINFALYETLQGYTNVQLWFESSVSEMKADREQANAVLSFTNEPSNELAINAKLLIGADGANSRVREHFGFKHTFADYDHHAIVVNVKTEKPHGNTARQAFTPFGPLAFLPLPDPYQSSIVFSQQTAQATQLMKQSDSDFAKTLQVNIDNHYGACELLTQRISFPLRMRYARQWTSDCVAIIGDAAHTIHPLAGQGANLGLADVSTLLSLLEASPNKLGQKSLLRQYERCRKAEAVKTIALMQGFKSLFDGEQAPKKLIRNLGLLGADKLPGLKAFFIKQAMGH